MKSERGDIVSKRKKHYQPTNTSKMVNQAIKKQRFDKQEAIGVEKGFIVAMSVIINILIEDYWTKTAHKKVPDLAEQSLGLLDAIQSGVVDVEDCIAYVEEQTGMRFNAEWLKHTGDHTKMSDLRNKYKEFLKTLETESK